MGAKTALLAFVDGDLRPALLGAMRASLSEVKELVGQVFPGYQVEPEGDATLDDIYPPDDITNATVLAGAELICDRRLVLDRPSELPPHLLAMGEGRRILMHGMHSVVDWLCFAVWENGRLIRSLSLSPDNGIIENIGEPLAFELPYWAGKHPTEPAWEDADPYPLPFHPLDLGEEALRALFGFILEGRPDPEDIDPEEVHMHHFRVSDPSGEEQAQRVAAYARVREAMGQRRMYRRLP